MLTKKDKIAGVFLLVLIAFTLVMTVITQEQKQRLAAAAFLPLQTPEFRIVSSVKADPEDDAYPYAEPEIVDISFEKKRSEYPAAATIWEFLKNQGYSDYIAAGLLGNFMCECAGQNLNLKVTVDSGTHYGIAQWSHKYFPEVYGTDLNTQLEFLMSNIEATFKIYGKLYKANFSYQDFLNLTNEQDVALAFAKVYERCGSGSYVARQRCATKAYEYFCK